VSVEPLDPGERSVVMAGQLNAIPCEQVGRRDLERPGGAYPSDRQFRRVVSVSGEMPVLVS
jgi:hypothetical protein